MKIDTLPTAIDGRPRKTKLALLDFLLRCFDAQAELVTVVQVGANDGRLDDPIWQFWSKDYWRGVLIEPHPVYFSDLSSMHEENPNVALVNCAVSEWPGKMDLYHMDEGVRDRCPRWLRGCASLTEERMLSAVQRANRNRGEDIPLSAVVCTQVSARRLDDILHDLEITQADLLLIDVEGHEVSVLNSFDLSSLNLKLAIIECNVGDRGDEETIVSTLNDAGLLTYKFVNDIVAVRPEVINVPVEAMLHFQNFVPLVGDRQPVPTDRE
ncbi:FkbM family methyltransferase [Ruegeria sp. 6PALISEP08]|uniref:FkbM family methyltransferase n=1 Tax=Ruegeria sp. 6PALISEP08 TaxID=1225660 RepID=UPI00067F1710|nr:FkbM family methyltransferase [Ruegeria sp. 6PALISEP08]